jgi:hypothetical protein
VAGKNAMPRANAAVELLNFEAMMFHFRNSEWLGRGDIIVLNWLTQRQTLFPVNHVLRRCVQFLINCPVV